MTYRYSTTIGKNGKCVRNERGKICGEIVGNCLKKRVKRSKHLLRKYNGWAFDEAILEQAKRKGVVNVEILDTENDELYRTSLEHILEYGIAFDFGFGQQVCLPQYSWEVSTVNATM